MQAPESQVLPQGDAARELARQELERRLANERGRYFVPNGKAEEFLKLLDNARKRPKGSITIFILRAGNGFSKTASALNLVNYLCDQTTNPYFDQVQFLREFKKPSVGRICTTANAAKKTYSQEIPKWFPRGQYTSSQKGREFDSYFVFKRTKAEFDIFTFDQDPESGESITLDWAIVDEPMSHRHWSGLKSRFRFGGIIIFILTPLEGSAWIDSELETEERLGNDVFVLEASAEDNCIEHGIRGVLPHAALEDMWKDFDESEMPARKDGKYLHMGGVIYRTYRDTAVGGHVFEELPDYYRECLDRGRYTLWNVIDPHDRKPFALGWHAAFPNKHVVTIAEWPDDSMPMFHKIKSWSWGVPEYAELMLATEQVIGKRADYRLIDPNFGVSQKAGEESTLAKFTKSKVGSKGWGLPPDGPGAVNQGHIAVKEWLGDPARGVAPLWHFMKHCRNHRFGMRKYGYDENRDETKGLSEKPELIYKDFPDLVRYAAAAKIRYIEPPSEDPSYYNKAPARRANGYLGA